MIIEDELYFDWICEIVCKERFSRNISYKLLLKYMHSVEFIVVIPNDVNRAIDGVDLRRRYYLENRNRFGEFHYWPDKEKDKPCSVLEMITALAIRCEETIMDDPLYGDRTTQWFWMMINNLGLSCCTDDKFNENFVRAKIKKFLNREYEPDGRGGLFRIKNCEKDLRDWEIWYQLCWYLDQIT